MFVKSQESKENQSSTDPLKSLSDFHSVHKDESLKVCIAKKTDKFNSSSFFENSTSQLEEQDSSFARNQSLIDEFTDDDDPGYDMYECSKDSLKEASFKIAEQNDFPNRAVYQSKYKLNEKSR